MIYYRIPSAPRIVIALLALVLISCAPVHRSADESRAGAMNQRGGELAVDSIGASEASLFELTFALTDANGHTRHMTDLRGEPFVASMIYTNCTSVCPRVTADLQALEKALPEDEREHTRFVLFSLDPERDTPAALRKFAREHALDATRWTLLAAGADDMRTLAAVFGVRFRPDGGGEIAHSAVIMLVDSGGVVRHRQMGLQNDAAPLLAAIRTATRAGAGSE